MAHFLVNSNIRGLFLREKPSLSSALSSTTSMSTGFSAKEAEYVREAEVYLAAFQNRFFDGSNNKLPVELELEQVFIDGEFEHRGFVSMRKTIFEFGVEFDDPGQNSGVQLNVEMKENLVGYLLGRTYPGPELKVEIWDPRWLKPLCDGLAVNPAEVKVLHFHFHFSSPYELHCITTLLETTHYERSLWLSGIIDDSSLKLEAYWIARVVRTNKLNMLDVSGLVPYEYSPRIFAGLAEALMVNTSLETVGIPVHPYILEGLEQRAKNSKARVLQSLTLVFVVHTIDIDEEGTIERLKAALSSNLLLKRIYLRSAKFSQSMWMQILESVKAITNLQVLDIAGSSGWEFTEVVDALLDIMRLHCTQIVDLGFKEPTRLPNRVQQFLPILNEQLRLNSLYGQALRDLHKGLPRSARVIFCGPGYAGKTTLCKTMLRKGRSGLERRFSLFLQNNPKLWRFLFGSDADKEVEKRTRGVDMHLWKDEGDLRISLWDFAGQKEYYALHDYVLPNVNSANLFLFTFSLVPSPLDSTEGNSTSARILEIEKELRFWLRFLCSNSKEFVHPKPRVRIVLTNADRVKDRKDWILGIVQVLARFRSFKDRLDLDVSFEKEMLLNSHSEEKVKELENKILEDFKGMMPKLEPTFTICEEVRKRLGERMRSSPVIKIEQYYRMLRDTEVHVKDAVASYLHNVGEIIYFKDLRFMVINPRWLGVGILGNLFHNFSKTSASRSRGVLGSCLCKGRSRSSESGRPILENGFVSRDELEAFLGESLRSVTYAENKCHISPDDLIALMLALEICYEDKDRGGYLIPAAFDDEEEKAARGLRRLEWRDVENPGPYVFIGRRLQCADQERTVLTPGFFPRLQVALRKHLLERKFIGERRELGSFEIDRNLLRFMHNTMDIIIEYAESEHFRGNFVDVLVKTLLSHESTTDFIEEHVLSVIRQFCAKPEGNQGVTLVEGIIRPKAVEDLVLCRYRENQSFLISDLEDHLKDDPSYRFCWNAVPHEANLPHFSPLRKPEHAYAIDAIRGEGFHARYEGNQTSDIPSTSEISSTPPRRNQDLSENPKLFYLVDDTAGSQTPFSSEARLRLCLQCEWRDGPHIVEGQTGRCFVFRGEARKMIMPLVHRMYETCKLAGLAAAKSVPFLGALEVAVNKLPPKVWQSESAAFEYSTIKMVVGDKSEDIVRYYEELLKAGPYCKWLTEFLDIRDEERFETDFKLKKARYKDTKEIAFLCDDCWLKGFSRHRQVLQFP